eukprot:112631-Rhodomonas_salina.1
MFLAYCELLSCLLCVRAIAGRDDDAESLCGFLVALTPSVPCFLPSLLVFLPSFLPRLRVRHTAGRARAVRERAGHVRHHRSAPIHLPTRVLCDVRY